MELTDSLKTLLIETAKSRKGSARRFFMARTVKEPVSYTHLTLPTN